MIGFVVFAFNSKDGFIREAIEEAERQQQEQAEGMEQAEEPIREENAE